MTARISKPPSWRQELRAGRRHLAGIALLLPLFSGCAAFQSPAETADAIATAHGFFKKKFNAGQFTLTGYLKSTGEAGTLTVYIEGDGAAWEAPGVPPEDPTPRKPVGLLLAVRDGGQHVLYVARPCQFVEAASNGHCGSVYWAGGRFNEKVVAALDSAIEAGRRLSGTSRVTLIGYSGGGVLAALLAARRTDVAGLMSVASPIDHAAWTTFHKITPLSESLNPAEFSDRLKGLPQVHFLGTEDGVVPAGLLEGFAKRMGNPPSARFITIEGFDHQCCWEERWGELRGLLP